MAAAGARAGEPSAEGRGGRSDARHACIRECVDENMVTSAPSSARGDTTQTTAGRIRHPVEYRPPSSPSNQAAADSVVLRPECSRFRRPRGASIVLRTLLIPGMKRASRSPQGSIGLMGRILDTHSPHGKDTRTDVTIRSRGEQGATATLSITSATGLPPTWPSASTNYASTPRYRRRASTKTAITRPTSPPKNAPNAAVWSLL